MTKKDDIPMWAYPMWIGSWLLFGHLNSKYFKVKWMDQMWVGWLFGLLFTVLIVMIVSEIREKKSTETDE